MFGGPGRTPAKNFTPVKQGKVKHTYSLRWPLCEKVVELVRSGLSGTVACGRVYKAYGQRQPLTTIIRRMKVAKCTVMWSEVLMVRVE